MTPPFLIRILILAFALHSVAPAAFVINEVDIDTPGTDNDEFIELKGTPFESTDGLIVVVYSRKTDGVVDSRHAFDIGGATADANGYFILGGRDVIEADYRMPGSSIIPAAPGAIALYQASVASFPTGTLPNSTGLQDVLAFVSAVDRPEVDWSGLGFPTVFDELSAANVTLLSLSRIPNQTGPFTPAGPSPKRDNALASYTITDPGFILVNQETALMPQLREAQITNQSVTPLSITGIQLGAATSPQITQVGDPTPSLPVTLTVGQSITVNLNFVEPDPSVNKTYSTVLDVTTDPPASLATTNTFTNSLVRGTPAAVGSVVINELCYNPNGADHNRDGTLSTASVQPDEFVELYNTTPNPILIEGWEQRNTNSDATATTFSFILPAGTTIAGNSFMTIFANGTPTGFTPGTTFVAGTARLRNSGASVGLSDGSKYIDAIAYLTSNLPPGFVDVGVSVTGGGSIGRLSDGSANWSNFPLNGVPPPTPNLSNTTPSDVSEWSLY